MKKSELRKLIKEELDSRNREKEYFNKIIKYIKDDIFPELNDQERWKLSADLKKWSDKNVKYYVDMVF